MFFVLYCRRLSLLLKCARGEFYLFMLWSLIKSDHHNMLHGRIERRIYVPTWSLAKKESEREREKEIDVGALNAAIIFHLNETIVSYVTCHASNFYLILHL